MSHRIQITLAAVVVAVAGLVAIPHPAEAKGCIKGAVVGGVAGHYAGHHGMLGAIAGCVIGRHEANKRAREDQARARNNSSNQGERF